MRSWAACVVVMLAAAAVACGLDLTTFRQSYSRAARADWFLDASASAGDETRARVEGDGGFGGLLDWKSAILSDNFDLGVEASAAARGFALGGGALDSLPVPTHDAGGDLGIASSALGYAYLPRTDLFLRGSLDGTASAGLEDARDRDGWSRDRSVAFGISASGLGLGYGRMRDAWPLLRAARLIGILRDEGALARELSDDDLRDLAGLLSRSWKLFYAHERGAKFYYDSLEQWLVNAGAIRGPLPAYTLFRMDEAPLIGTDNRRFGWRAYATVALDAHRRTEWHEDVDTSVVRLDTSYQHHYEAGFEFSRPVGLRWTYGASATYVLPWPHEPGAGTKHELDIVGSASYDITDRMVADYTISAQPCFEPPVGPYGYGHLSLPRVQTLVFSYYLSERFAVRLGGRYTEELDGYYGRYSHYTASRRHWGMALIMTFGRIPTNWGEYYYL